MFKKQSSIKVAEWWHFDSAVGILYGEEKSGGGVSFFKFGAMIVESDVENAWLAISSETEQKMLLWKDRELVPETEIVAEVWPWYLRANHGLTYALYACIAGKCRWEKIDTVSAKLNGKYRDGGYFEDYLRLIIPLENDSVIAISNRNRQYYLHGPAIDEELILSPKKKHKSRRNIIS